MNLAHLNATCSFMVVLRDIQTCTLPRALTLGHLQAHSPKPASTTASTRDGRIWPERGFACMLAAEQAWRQRTCRLSFSSRKERSRVRTRHSTGGCSGSCTGTAQEVCPRGAVRILRPYRCTEHLGSSVKGRKVRLRNAEIQSADVLMSHLETAASLELQREVARATAQVTEALMTKAR